MKPIKNTSYIFRVKKEPRLVEPMEPGSTIRMTREDDRYVYYVYPSYRGREYHKPKEVFWNCVEPVHEASNQ